MAEIFDEDENVRLLRTIPGVGEILSVVIANEVGDVSRFPLSGPVSGIRWNDPERTRIGAASGDMGGRRLIPTIT